MKVCRNGDEEALAIFIGGAPQTIVFSLRRLVPGTITEEDWCWDREMVPGKWCQGQLTAAFLNGAGDN
jgi:hypothetical protein